MRNICLLFLSSDRTGQGSTIGKRGRPLGSVGRRKLLENNQESLKTEMRLELGKHVSPNRDEKIEVIRLKIQVFSVICYFTSLLLYVISHHNCCYINSCLGIYDYLIIE